MLTFSTFLTLFRLCASLTILPFLLLYTAFPDKRMSYYIAGLFFVMLALTDFFDGYIARKSNTTSQVGAFLDPIADKCLITVTILCLVFLNRMHVIFAIPMVCREILILSLRQYAAENGMIISVSSSGKIKTAFQCIALCAAIIMPDVFYGELIKNILLSLATYFSISSLIQYFQNAQSLFQ